MTKLTVLSADDKRAEIRRLYFSTTRQTIDRDWATAVKLLTSMESEEERERARVFMEGLTQMRSDWAREDRRRAGGSKKPGKKPDAKAAAPAAKPGRDAPRGPQQRGAQQRRPGKPPGE